MDALLIAPSARKHGIPDSDMIHVFNHPIFVDELDDGFTMFVGAPGCQPARDRCRRHQ